MIIDYILDRKYDEESAAQGCTHYRRMDGLLVEIKYRPDEFYRCIAQYIGGCGGENAVRITRAMDSGTEDDVRRELCAYVRENGYPEHVCEYINSRTWITEG